jgi:hypothetical protein
MDGTTGPDFGINSVWVQPPLRRIRLRSDFWIADRQNPSSRQWIGKTDQRYDAYTQDCAIISRVQEPTTGQTVVSLVSLGLLGTAAEAEFATNPVYMDMVAGTDSSEWKKEECADRYFNENCGRFMGSAAIVGLLVDKA